MTTFFLILISILPVAVLMFIMYKLDKFQKEPIKSLLKAFLGGAFVPIIITTILDLVTEWLYPNYPLWFEDIVMAGFYEELSKFLVFMIFIWRDKNFDEFFDGIVYASFIGLGFACTENIGYVIGSFAEEGTVAFAAGVALKRAFYAVPGHFLDGIILGFFLSLAKFREEKRWLYILTGMAIVVFISHGLWDLLIDLYIFDYVSNVFYYIASNVLYVALWILGVNFIRKHRENSRLQAELASANEQPTSDNNELTNS